ncbi:hypothetical protein NC652_019110 [Populus alba x Populus x berolinensis]|nr:hypothetical protein NC652_019106 [Populus alba x Populus x berolinensis]KAJ6916595.1 hypothetical protein NC652_019110 [Populus alba x Populus x berolinensis]
MGREKGGRGVISLDRKEAAPPWCIILDKPGVETITGSAFTATLVIQTKREYPLQLYEFKQAAADRDHGRHLYHRFFIWKVKAEQQLSFELPPQPSNLQAFIHVFMHSHISYRYCKSSIKAPLATSPPSNLGI